MKAIMITHLDPKHLRPFAMATKAFISTKAKQPSNTIDRQLRLAMPPTQVMVHWPLIEAKHTVIKVKAKVSEKGLETNMVKAVCYGRRHPLRQDFHGIVTKP
jgi:hypothetical protein